MELLRFIYKYHRVLIGKILNYRLNIILSVWIIWNEADESAKQPRRTI